MGFDLVCIRPSVPHPLEHSQCTKRLTIDVSAEAFIDGGDSDTDKRW